MNKRIQKGFSLILSLALVLSTFAVPSVTKTVYASESDVAAPTTGTYLAKADFTSDSFNNTYGFVISGHQIAKKVYFGTNSDIWWMAGVEAVTGSDISATTLVLFSSEVLSETVKYDNVQKSTKAYYANYAKSSIRNTVLNNLLSGRFSPSEREAIVPVTLKYAGYTSSSTYNENMTVTNCKLYLPDGVSNSNYVKVGQSNFYVLYKYWPNKRFWLRSAGNRYYYARYALSQNNVVYVEEKINIAYTSVAPALNMNLTSVIFSSAAPSASSTDAKLKSGTPMTLRFNSAQTVTGSDCTDRIQSSATANADGVTIENPTNTEFLYVQWSEDGADKVKSVELSSQTSFVSASNLLGAELNENCKIWLEKKVDNITYAKNVKFELRDASCTTIGKEGLEYNNEEQELVTTTSVTGGTVYYASDSVSWTTQIPKAKNAGEYYVWYKVEGDANHNNITPTNIGPIKIAKASVGCTTPTSISDLVYSGQEQNLINQVTDVRFGEVYYCAGIGLESPANWSKTVPTGTDAGIYKVWYKVSATDVQNCESSTPLSIEAVIAKAEASIESAEGYTVDDEKRIITATDGYELTTDTNPTETSATVTSIKYNNFSETYYVRKAENNNYYASAWMKIGLKISISDDFVITEDNIRDIIKNDTERKAFKLSQGKKVKVRGEKPRAEFAKAIKEGRITGFGAGIIGKEYFELSGLEEPEVNLFGAELLGDAASLEDVYYSTLEEALENAESGDYVYLTSTYTDIALDIPEGVTIVPNGYKFRMYRAEIATDTDASIVASYTSVQEAVNAINKKGSPFKGEIRLITNSDENFEVLSNMELTFDLNGFTLGGKKNAGNITSEGKIIIKDSSEVTSPSTNTALGKGEVKGDLIYKDDSHIEIINGIFRAIEENDKIIDDDSQGFMMNLGGTEKWVVASKNVASAMMFGLEYKVYDKSGVEVTDTDSEPGLDFCVGDEYTAKIYFTGAEGIKIRSFDFTANYDIDKIKVEVPYSANNKYTTLDGDWDKGLMHYTMAVNDDVKIGTDGNVEVAEFTFKINENNKNLNVRGEFTLDFNKDATVGTMKSINEIPVAAYEAVSGYLSNKYDGIKLVDYAYAPEGYKLAIISNDTSSSADKKFNLEGFSADKVYYTENPAYVAQSTNPKGLNIYGKSVENMGVFLAFVKDTASETDISKLIGHKSVGYTLFDTTNYLGGKVDVNSDGKVSANDASDVYQMLINETKWGFDDDNSQLYIPTFERLLSESNFDGKLYGTIEDVNNIINYYTKLNLF